MTQQAMLVLYCQPFPIKAHYSMLDQLNLRCFLCVATGGKQQAG
jgi:hypothetical protein